MIEALAGRIAQSIKQANPEQTSSVEVLRFSLIIVLDTVAVVLISLIIGLLSGKFVETGIALFAFAFLKYFSGGIHLKSSGACIFWSAIAMSSLPHIPLYDGWIFWITGLSVVTMILLAPINMSQKLKISSKYYPYMKMAAVLIVASNILINSDILAKTFLLQAISLIYVKLRG